MKYRVTGTIEYNWSLTVEADSALEAVELAKGLAEDEDGIDIPTGDIEVTNCWMTEE